MARYRGSDRRRFGLSNRIRGLACDNPDSLALVKTRLGDRVHHLEHDWILGTHLLHSELSRPLLPLRES